MNPAIGQAGVLALGAILGAAYRADFNADGRVDARDAAILVAHFGATERSSWCEADPARRAHVARHSGDATGDGVVDAADLAILAEESSVPAEPPVAPIASAHVTTIVADRSVRAVDAHGADRFTILDAARISQNPGDVWFDHTNPRTGLRPEIDIRPTPDGFDLVATYRNTTDRVRTHGTIRIGGFLPAQGGPVFERMFRLDDRERATTASSSHSYYPSGGVYSPTWTLRATFGSDADPSRTREYIVGVSVLYPVLEYRHGVDFWLKRSKDAEYFLDISPNLDNDGAQVLDNHPDGDIPPGAVRTYTICVRIMPVGEPPAPDSVATHRNDYLYLFREYKRYFKSLYGEVRYTRDPRPVNGYQVAGVQGATRYNSGFIEPRIDRTVPPGSSESAVTRDIAWRGWIDRLKNAEARGFHRFMLWAPSGVAANESCPDGTFNYPFQFTSRWAAVASGQTMHAILYTQPDLRRWAMGSGRELGLWWGNSARPVPWGTCDGPDLHVLDPCLPDDVAAGDVEMGDERAQTGPYAVGASAVGLDAFSVLQPDIAYVWLRRLTARNPTVRFLTEPVCADFLHTLAPAFIGASVRTPSGAVEQRIQSTNAMADFLNQGHETWAQIHQLPDTPGSPQGATELLKRIAADLAARGFVPVIGGNTAWEDGPYAPGRTRWHTTTLGPDLLDPQDDYSVESFDAARSWEFAVPAPLRD